MHSDMIECVRVDDTPTGGHKMSKHGGAHTASVASLLDVHGFPLQIISRARLLSCFLLVIKKCCSAAVCQPQTKIWNTEMLIVVHLLNIICG